MSFDYLSSNHFLKKTKYKITSNGTHDTKNISMILKKQKKKIHSVFQICKY